MLDIYSSHTVMPESALVVIEYGPYKACGVVEHRDSRLHGMQANLTRNGHTVKLVEIQDWNTVNLKVNGESIYQCDITDLDYGGDGKLDPICLEAAVCVFNAY